MPDEDSFELPAEWTQQGWTKETASAPDQDNSQGWGDASADLTPADPSTAVASSDDSSSTDTSTQTS